MPCASCFLRDTTDSSFVFIGSIFLLSVCGLVYFATETVCVCVCVCVCVSLCSQNPSDWFSLQQSRKQVCVLRKLQPCGNVLFWFLMWDRIPLKINEQHRHKQTLIHWLLWSASVKQSHRQTLVCNTWESIKSMWVISLKKRFFTTEVVSSAFFPCHICMSLQVISLLYLLFRVYAMYIHFFSTLPCIILYIALCECCSVWVSLECMTWLHSVAYQSSRNYCQLFYGLIENHCSVLLTAGTGCPHVPRPLTLMICWMLWLCNVSCSTRLQTSWRLSRQ